MLPNQLMFTVGLIDQITKPIAKISKGLNGLTSNYQSGSFKMASGIAGIAASGYALQNALMPAIEMDRALGEVKSLGVRESALKQLTETSYDYALKYGESATEFIKSSYDIQSAIEGLNDADLSNFTLSSNVLAKATKADAATITNYMGTMYGIFKNDANVMGKGEWVEQITGMTAKAVQMFKTEGKEMSSAFSALGKKGGLAPLQEQMAILGTLQSTLSGSESATKYKAFINGAIKAQKSLGLTFVDSKGVLLPMVDILQKIKGKYGDLTNGAAAFKVSTAFGSTEATDAIQLLINNVDGLQGSINKLGKVKGMEQAEKMAAAMVDQSQRLSESWFVIRAALGTALLPLFNKFAGWLADAGTGIVDFTKEFPTLTKIIGYTAIALLGLVAAGGLFTMMMGAGQMAMVAFGVGGKIATAALWLFGIQAKKSTAAMLGFNIVAAANPIGLIVLGITAAIAAVVGLIYYWDEFKTFMSDLGWVKVFLAPLNMILALGNAISWVIDKFKGFSGSGIDVNANTTSAAQPINAIAPVKNKAQMGGITQQISNANQQKSTTIGEVNVYPAKGETNFMNYVEALS